MATEGKVRKKQRRSNKPTIRDQKPIQVAKDIAAIIGSLWPVIMWILEQILW
jgi:hypothetical protein